MEPQRHEDTKFLPGLLKLRLAGKKVFLCAFVVQGFYAFCDNLLGGNGEWLVFPHKIKFNHSIRQFNYARPSE